MRSRSKSDVLSWPLAQHVDPVDTFWHLGLSYKIFCTCNMKLLAWFSDKLISWCVTYFFLKAKIPRGAEYRVWVECHPGDLETYRKKPKTFLVLMPCLVPITVTHWLTAYSRGAHLFIMYTCLLTAFVTVLQFSPAAVSPLIWEATTDSPMFVF